MNGLRSELLKYKRTFMGKLIVFAPAFFAVYGVVIMFYMQNDQAVAAGNTSMSWESLLALIFNWWSFLFLPLGAALFATMAAAQEKKAGNYRALRTRNISPVEIWVNKIAGMASYSLISTFVLVIITLVTGYLTANGLPPLAQIIEAALVCWISMLALFPIQLWAATCGGIFLSMGIGFIGMVVGVVVAPLPLWFIMPWSWATRMMCPIVGIHPNGLILEAGNPLLNFSVVPAGILLSLIAATLLTLLTAAWFKHREV